MECPVCKFDNPPGAFECGGCHRALETVLDGRMLEGATLTRGGVAPGWSRAEPAAAHVAYAGLASLAPGTMLAGRYEILQMLGEGGMGAVFKARDTELDRVVAIKVIRPEMAGNPEVLQRFKQELILARQVTHKNVIRIFDLGQADAVKFISMEFVEGQDLKHLLREKGKLSQEEAVKVIQQVCRALEAAHSEGVTHRDLKPQNIMVEQSGRVLVMDFGIARSVETSGLTQTGALLGTPEYMSPEQAKGEKIDTRSDLFSLGVIFYQLLTGILPYQSETAMGTLLKRVQHPAIPPGQVDPSLPPALSAIVVKCLAIKPEERYQTVQEILHDIELWRGPPEDVAHAVTLQASVSPLSTPTLGTPAVAEARVPPSFTRYWKLAAVCVSVLLLAIAGFVFRGRFVSRPAATPKPVTVLVADFNNATGDPVFDGTLEPMFKLALEGAGFVTAYDRTKMRDLGLPPSGKLDEPAARRIAVSQGLGAVVSGSLDRQGTGYQLSVKAVQAVTGNPISTAEVSAPDKDKVLFAVTKVAATIRIAMGDATSESAQRFAMETLTATSLEAVHEYALAMESLSRGNNDAARQGFSKAVDLDPNFGLSYAGMAIASRNLGDQQEAERYVKLAVSHTDHMTERERYRTRGLFYLVIGNRQKCVEEYSSLIAGYSSDVAAHNNLALCYTDLRNMPKAIEEMRRAVEILPKRALYHLNLALYASFGGDFQTAEREARAAQELNPSYPGGFIALAFAQLGQDRLAEAGETYRKLEQIRASDAASGLGDLALYEGRFSEAVQILEKGAAADLAAKSPDRAADKFAALAYTQILRGQKGPAVAAAKSALANSQAVQIRFLTARVFVEAGETSRARELASSLGSELQAEPQADARLIAGEVALKEGDPRQAIKEFTEANRLLDTWIGRFDLGRAYLEAGAFTEADSEFDRCIKRRGEALALALNEVPTYGYFPPVYYFQGRVREGLKSTGSAESYRKYLGIRGKAGEDPLLAEVRRRSGQ